MRRSLQWVMVLYIGAVLLTVAAMTSMSIRPLVGLLLAAAVPTILGIVSSPVFRLLVVVLGGLLVFQGTASGPKFGYLGLALLCFVISALSLYQDNSDTVRVFRPFILAATLLLAMVVTSYLVSQSNAISVSDWFRDSLTYVLLATLPVVGLDAGRRLSRTQIDYAIVLFGVLAALGFATDWLNRRGVSTLAFGHILLATTTLAALGFCHALTRAAQGRNTVAWVSASTVIAISLIVTGTRTNLILLVAFIGALGAKRKSRIPWYKLLSLLIPVVLLTVLLVPIIAARVINDPNFLSDRVRAALSVLHGGSDQSLLARQQSYMWAEDQFHLYPWLGGGPGHVYPNGLYVIDTPWLIPAKFGLIGSAMIVIYLLSIALSSFRMHRLVGLQPINTTARAWGLVLLCFTPLQPWTEDKGTSLALTLLCAAMMQYARDPEMTVSSTLWRKAVPGGMNPLASGSVQVRQRVDTKERCIWDRPMPLCGDKAQTERR